jgi:hypothetical protein
MDSRHSGSLVRDCAAQLPYRYRRHDQDLVGGRVCSHRPDGLDGNLLPRRCLTNSNANSDCNSHSDRYCNGNTYTNGNADRNSHRYCYCNRNTYTNGDRNFYSSRNGNTYCNCNTYANGNADCHYNDNGYTNRNSKHHTQAGSYTTPTSYYAAAASVGFDS